MIPSWLVIGGVALIVALVNNIFINKRGTQWFKRLRRPEWLTFEAAIPFIWIFVFICGAVSAYLVWEANPGQRDTWLLMGFYLLLEIVILSYTSVMLNVRSLKIGTVIGATGVFLGAILFILVIQISLWAGLLLLPYLLWSPVGTITTWQMTQLNPADA